MFPDPNRLNESTPAEILDAGSRGHLGLDHRFLKALLDRRAETLPALIAFAERERSRDAVDLAPELIALFRHWKAPEGIPFLIEYIREDPENVPDEAMEALVEIGQPALDPLLALYESLEESESGEVAFILANLRIPDERILKILTDRLEYDLSDTLMLLTIHGDPAARVAIERAGAELEEGDADLKAEVADALNALSNPDTHRHTGEQESFDIYADYPVEEDLPIDLLDEDERWELLGHPVGSVRAAAANSFFNRELTPEQRTKLLNLAKEDESATVRARAWESLVDSTEETEVVDALLATMRNAELTVEERGGVLVALSAEADRNEVRNAMIEMYNVPGGRAKALEAMWRSVHPSFRDYFSKHLEDADLEVRRAAVWGIGYYGIRSELDRLRKLFEHDELRSDAIFAYSLAIPAELSRGRMKGLLSRIEKDAHGLSEMEEELVKAALDERLMLAGKEPVFRQQED
ncbi:MAG: HEAT repeat domain-containing protein [Acidobacteriaceae bacterium]|nr:HEAT repeat domain-containing protein [Acidobacteriaceae bacterium]